MLTKNNSSGSNSASSGNNRYDNLSSPNSPINFALSHDRNNNNIYSVSQQSVAPPPPQQQQQPSLNTSNIINNNYNTHTNNTNNNNNNNNNPNDNNNNINNKNVNKIYTDRQKLYKLWPGRNKLLCHGRLMIGPDVRQLILTVILILIPFIMFEAFEASYFIIIHPAGVVVAVVPLLAVIYIYASLFVTATSDPGILPRRCVIYNNLHNENPDNEDQSKQYPPLFQTVLVNGEEQVLKFCYSCEIYRPPRTSHCPRCDNCVEKFDHHCPWTGTCIGKRNYRPFAHFVTSATIALIVTIGTCAFQIAYSCVKLAKMSPFVANGKTIWKIICTAASIPIIIYCLGALIFVGSLWSFHSYLVCTNQTTYETIKKRRGKNDSGFSEGPLRNFFGDYLCAPCEPSRIPFRQPLSEYQLTTTNSADVIGLNSTHCIRDATGPFNVSNSNNNSSSTRDMPSVV